METKILRCEKITGSNFSNYGTYVSPAGRKPDADNEELKFWNKIGTMDLSGRTTVSIVQTYGKNGLVERTLERHSKSSETLIPTDDVVIVVALTDSKNADAPDLSTAKAFFVEKGCAVILGKKTWHHAPLTSRDYTNTFVMFEEKTPETDGFAVDLPKQFGCEFSVKL